jgi:glycosyltransferase involved in cell wall biosynthesis
MKTAIAHDWLPVYSGAEQVVSRIMEVVGPSDLFTLYDFLSDSDRAKLGAASVHVSRLNKIPFIEKFYRYSFPFCPGAIESFDLSGYDLVVSSSAAFAKGVIVHPHQKHIAYIHTPVRYAWDQTFEYLSNTRFGRLPFRPLLEGSLHRLRMWDARTAHGPDLFVANSTIVQRRIEQIYGRRSIVIHPPVDTERFPLCEDKDDYYVVASRLVPYKRIDLIVQAFAGMPNKRLLVVGDGPDKQRLMSSATANVEFKGHVPRQELVETIRHAKAFVFAGCEDFGIVMAEALAAGTPVIAYRRGGAADIVSPLGGPTPTGVFFDRQDHEAVSEAIRRFEDHGGSIHAEECHKQAQAFSVSAFQAQLRTVIDAVTDPSFKRGSIEKAGKALFTERSTSAGVAARSVVPALEAVG